PGEAQRDLTAGTHALQVDYTRPEASVPRVRLSWQALPGGELEVVRSQPEPWRLAVDLAVIVSGAAALGAWILRLGKRAWLAARPCRRRSSVARPSCPASTTGWSTRAPPATFS